jgi:hypothetical protein
MSHPNDFRKESSVAGLRPQTNDVLGRLRGVVSDEFATGNEFVSLTAPMILNLFPAGANLTSIGEVILWGYLDDPMSLRRRGRGTHAMVATLKRLPPRAASEHHRESVPCVTAIFASCIEVTA